MTARKIAAKDLARLVAGWAKATPVYAPVKVRKWTEYRRVASLGEACLDRVDTKVGPKELLFPQREVMFRFRTGQAEAEAPAAPESQMIFGVRPCDAAAIAVLDKFFIGQAEVDDYYRARRERTTIVGLACNQPDPACFCLAVGGSPAGTRGLDLLLTDLGDGFLAESVTARGEELVAALPEATDKDRAHKQELAEKAAAAIGFRIDTTALKAKLDAGFDHRVWEELSRPCVNCAACTFLCPTCHCFDVTDEERKGKGSRIRVWDSCQFCTYSRHASGHNPRALPHTRYRNRVMDKFKYTLDMIEELSCVGCGRCIRECPAGIDIRETAKKLGEALA